MSPARFASSQNRLARVASSRRAELPGLTCGYGLLGDCSDFLFGFWGAAGLMLLPAFLLLAWLLTRCAPGIAGHVLAAQLLIFGILYPCLAGLDAERQSLYFDLAAVLYLVVAAWLLLRVFRPGA